jgi:hypothetical protein
VHREHFGDMQLKKKKKQCMKNDEIRTIEPKSQFELRRKKREKPQKTDP